MKLTRKRIAVFCKESLLASAVENLLAGKKDIVFRDLSRKKADLARQMEIFRPNIIITEEESFLDFGPEFFGLLRSGNDLNILVIHQQKNRIRLLRHQEISITKSEDLLEAIF